MDKPWFKFTASNWLSGSVQLLTDSEKGTYIDLIAMIWKEGGKLENTKILHRKLRLDHATACDRIDSYCELGILHCEDDILSIKFLDSQLDDMADKSQKAKENAEKRWSKTKDPMQPHANKKRREEKREEEKRKEESNKTKALATDIARLDFDIFRKSYPGVKKGLDTEFNDFKKNHKDYKEVIPDLLAILKCQVNQRETLKMNKQFVPEWKHLKTWLSQRCWEEETESQPETSYKDKIQNHSVH